MEKGSRTEEIMQLYYRCRKRKQGGEKAGLTPGQTGLTGGRRGGRIVEK